jgi:HAD superfamily phosphatase (TIGR01668 family)
MWRSIGRKYFTPDKKFKDVTEINLEDLKNEGVKGILMDLDDTLLPSDKKLNKATIDNWLLKAKKDFSLFVISNNRRHDYVKKFCEKFDIPFIARATKPRSKYLQIALEKMNLDKKDVVIIGDRLTTDILAGKRFGIKAFLVAPLTEKPNRLQKFIYKIEAYVLKAIEPIAVAAPLKQEVKESIKEERARAEIKAEIRPLLKNDT